MFRLAVNLTYASFKRRVDASLETQHSSRQLMQIMLNRPFFKKVIIGYLISIGVYSIAYIPVIVFTFIGLSQTPYLVETNPRLNEFMQTHGLVIGLLFGYLSTLEIVGPVLGAAHLVYVRPVVFAIHKDMKFARRIVTSLIGLLILFWGWTFFIDAYNDLQILLQSEVWIDAALWPIFLLSLGLFLARLVLWGAVLLTATYVLKRADVVGAVASGDADLLWRDVQARSDLSNSNILLDKPDGTGPLV